MRTRKLSDFPISMTYISGDLEYTIMAHLAHAIFNVYIVKIYAVIQLLMFKMYVLLDFLK